MNKEQLDFLLKYAKKGVLSSKKDYDEIEYEEIKDQYIRIKTELINISQSIQSVPETMEKIKDTIPGEKKESAVKTWFSGIGDRQRKYKETHKDEIV